MQNFRSILRSINLTLDKGIYFFGRKLKIGHRASIYVVPYLGYASRERVYLKGRVLRRKPQAGVTIGSNKEKRTLLYCLRRWLTFEVRHAYIKVKIADETFLLTTDIEGYFKLDAAFSKPWENAKNGWNSIEMELVSVPWRKLEQKVDAEVLFRDNFEYGVISDIDDTVVQTEVTSLLKIKMLYIAIFKSAYDRNAIEGVGTFYRAMKKGPTGNANNPVFYVSKSPWNLYETFTEFFIINQLPKGPMQLRDFGLPYEQRPKSYRGHKYESMAHILTTFPEKPFILIGDSGEKDIDLFLQLSEAFPGQIQGIYIRDVQSEKRARRIRKLIEQNPQVEIQLIADYAQATKHAIAKGWIQA